MRPPYPAVSGLWHKPTLINNVETLAKIAYIMRHNRKGVQQCGNGKIARYQGVCPGGKGGRGGLIEVPMGMTIREVVEEIGGGVADGRTFKAIQIGGPSGGCIPASMSETPIDFESLNEVGAMMGSGGMVVLDDTDCMVDMARYFLSFHAERIVREVHLLPHRYQAHAGDPGEDHRRKRGDEGPGGAGKAGRVDHEGEPVRTRQNGTQPDQNDTGIFRDEYVAHINGTCPTGKCKELIRYEITDDCIGCTLCAQDCPVDAIPFKPHEKHEIDLELCIKCDGCRQVCPEDAVIII
jgi:NADH-quinone oxidoreductase subunit F